jgi:hypothetical protein
LDQVEPEEVPEEGEDEVGFRSENADVGGRFERARARRSRSLTLMRVISCFLVSEMFSAARAAASSASSASEGSSTTASVLSCCESAGAVISSSDSVSEFSLLRLPSRFVLSLSGFFVLFVRHLPFQPV